MRMFRAVFAILPLALIVAIGSAQGPARPGRQIPKLASPAVVKALNALQQDLVDAIASMKTALPIYDGNRVRSIRAAHTALVLVDRAIYGTKAVARENPNVNDQVSSGKAKGKYTAQQIAESQTNMRQGLTFLQSAWTDLQAAVGSTPNKQGVLVSGHLQKAINEATTAIGLHDAQG